jgi:uncharacterized DUF497 family protein
MTYEWDELNRLTNLSQHGLDFHNAWRVYEHTYKLTLQSPYPHEQRLIDIADVNGRVLLLVYTTRGATIRCISFCYAKRKERRLYYEQNR